MSHSLVQIRQLYEEDAWKMVIYRKLHICPSMACPNKPLSVIIIHVCNSIRSSLVLLSGDLRMGRPCSAQDDPSSHPLLFQVSEVF